MTRSKQLLIFPGNSRESDVGVDAESIVPQALPPRALETLGRLLHPAMPTLVFATYWIFSAERQNILFRRLEGEVGPWTKDVVLRSHRFTNAYRAVDRVSQFLIASVQNGRKWSAEDLFFRTILFKIFNRIETWEWIKKSVGEPMAARFSPREFGRILDEALAKGERIYSAAYIMPSGGTNSAFKRKHEMHLHLIGQMLEDDLAAAVRRAGSMAEAFALIRAYPTIGDFLAYQYVTDLNYSNLVNFTEREFVVAGPGAREGITKCFSDLGGKTPEWIIEQVTKVQCEAFRALGLTFRYFGTHELQYIDCQNLFCEVAKYARVMHPDFTPKGGRTRIKQRFEPNPKPLAIVFPAKWGIEPLSPVPALRHVAGI